MSQKNRERRMRDIWKRRGRTPVEAIYEIRQEVIRSKSRAGVEYVSYKPIILKKNA